ncbi:hypothetical protein ROE7235_03702 [Roseibaca ekhonensis]|jgi:hypothetical protein|uniref:Uncharacterized protein n=1 Tax=Roseinatronobacter ekhonensis TaxID=254356 RepID=A0A3B0MDJ1_9RHOB|nr:hypothetical protein [Roseibaca ekhonensis]SUZ33921.1 hypothetical protein ROE7235_03702 [Roseibaca ekhonensis]
MKVGGVLGIIGGLISLLIGVVGYSSFSAIGGLASSMDYETGAQTMNFYSLASIALPILGLGGAASCFVKPRKKGISLVRSHQEGAILMAVSAAGILWLFGINALSLVPAVLLGLGALLVFNDLPEKSPSKTDLPGRREQVLSTDTATEPTESVRFDQNGMAPYRGRMIRRDGDKFHVGGVTLDSLNEAKKHIDK